ncbi:serine/threonine protein kinase [Paludibaculum fermentans]|uniref:non-specific serine/threonine protein kinase n=1 Tax=Paludibaculum fermentans TaxID=1473598 RepID=A0A7S7SIL7_PALFE|nr:serine/threonine-protein kinase [Paludibaculum fermentans]QOY85596.1 serine/threonine protein kinase [Paludibaculum fermentans]
MTTRTIGNYRFTRQLGAGGMGAVFEAVDVMVDRRVAIKMLHSEIARQPDLIERFKVEAATLAKLNHPCTATLFSFFRDGDDYYMVMEFVPGRTLDQILKTSGPLPVDSAVSVIQQVLQGLAHAHRTGVLHRDIKPANIMISDDGHVKVTDFGIARVLGSSRLTRMGSVIGTLEYLAPERIRFEEADSRSDIYSTGVVLFEALAGRAPFLGASDREVLQAHLEQPPPSLRALGVNCAPELEAVVGRALAKKADDRFQSADEFREALLAVPVAARKPTRLASDEPSAPPPPETRLAAVAQPGPSAVRKSQLPLLAGVLAIAVVAAASGVWVLQHSAPPPPPQPPVEVVRNQPPPQQQAPSLPPGSLDAPASIAPAGSITPILNEPTPVQPVAPSRPALTPEPRKKVALPPLNAAVPETKPVEPAERPRAAAPPPVETPAPAPAPTPAAPARPTVRALRDVRTIFVEKMDNDLDVYLRIEIAEQLAGFLSVVQHKEEADAVLSGRSEDTATTGSKVTGGYLGIKDQARGAVTLRDRGGHVDLWSGEAGDKSLIIGAVKRGGSRKVAERLVGNLKKAIKSTR